MQMIQKNNEWNNDKGLNQFIELSKVIDNDKVIVLIGKLPKEIKLPNNIIPINQTDDIYELVRYYNIADVFLQLSSEETFGKVVAEALACGTPVVTINSTANPELIGENCGYIANINNIYDVNRYIDIIRFNKKSFYSNSCRTFAIQNFNKEEKISEYIRLCKNLISYKGDV